MGTYVEFSSLKKMRVHLFSSLLNFLAFQSNGQPPLHKAVLRSNLKMVRILADSITNILNKKIDDIRDHVRYRNGLMDGMK